MLPEVRGQRGRSGRGVVLSRSRRELQHAVNGLHSAVSDRACAIEYRNGHYVIKDDGLKIEAFIKAGEEAGLSERTTASLVRDCKYTLGTIPDRVAEIARTFIIKDAVLKGMMA